MVGLCVLLILLWLVLLVLAPPQSMGLLPINEGSDYSSDVLPRGYGYGYSQVGSYPFLPFLEPLVILGGLAFLAFLVQTFQVFFLAHQAATAGHIHNPSLLGGIVSSVVPTKLRTLGTEDERLDDILAAIRLYKKMDKKRKRENEQLETENRGGGNTTSLGEEENIPVLVPLRTIRYLRKRRR